MECLEDGECPSSPEELHPNSDMEQNGVATQPIYTPLPRPQVSSTSSQSSRDTNVQPCKNTPKLLGSLKSAPLTCSTTNQIDPHVNCTFSSSNSDSSEDDSDSDRQHRAWVDVWSVNCDECSESPGPGLLCPPKHSVAPVPCSVPDITLSQSCNISSLVYISSASWQISCISNTQLWSPRAIQFLNQV